MSRRSRTDELQTVKKAIIAFEASHTTRDDLDEISGAINQALAGEWRKHSARQLSRARIAELAMIVGLARLKVIVGGSEGKPAKLAEYLVGLTSGQNGDQPK